MLVPDGTCLLNRGVWDAAGFGLQLALMLGAKLLVIFLRFFVCVYGKIWEKSTGKVFAVLGWKVLSQLLEAPVGSTRAVPANQW